MGGRYRRRIDVHSERYVPGTLTPKSSRPRDTKKTGWDAYCEFAKRMTDLPEVKLHWKRR